MFGSLFAVALLLIFMAGGLRAAETGEESPAVELVGVVFILFVFFVRYGYFLWFELGPRGATPGKRALGIRVAPRRWRGRGLPPRR